MARGLQLAALRHRRGASHLAAKKEQGEACYLIGLAAECAIKYYLQTIKFPLERAKRSKKKTAIQGKNLLYVHFPELAAELLVQGDGILAGRIIALINDPQLLNGWTVKMRYRDQPSSPAMTKQYEKWCKQADTIFREVGL